MMFSSASILQCERGLFWSKNHTNTENIFKVYCLSKYYRSYNVTRSFQLR